MKEWKVATSSGAFVEADVLDLSFDVALSYQSQGKHRLLWMNALALSRLRPTNPHPSE